MGMNRKTEEMFRLASQIVKCELYSNIPVRICAAGTGTALRTGTTPTPGAGSSSTPTGTEREIEVYQVMPLRSPAWWSQMIVFSKIARIYWTNPTKMIDLFANIYPGLYVWNSGLSTGIGTKEGIQDNYTLYNHQPPLELSRPLFSSNGSRYGGPPTPRSEHSRSARTPDHHRRHRDTRGSSSDRCVRVRMWATLLHYFNIQNIPY